MYKNLFLLLVILGFSCIHISAIEPVSKKSPNGYQLIKAISGKGMQDPKIATKEEVQKLITLGESVKTVDVFGYTALIWALKKNYPLEIIELLIRAGSNIEHQWEQSGTVYKPLRYVVSKQVNYEIAYILLDFGANYDDFYIRNFFLDSYSSLQKLRADKVKICLEELYSTYGINLPEDIIKMIQQCIVNLDSKSEIDKVLKIVPEGFSIDQPETNLEEEKLIYQEKYYETQNEFPVDEDILKDVEIQLEQKEKLKQLKEKRRGKNKK